MAVPTTPFQPGSFFLPPLPVHQQSTLLPPAQTSSLTNQWTCSPGLFPLPLGPPNFGGFINLRPPATPYHPQPPRFHHSNRNHHPFNGRKGAQRGQNRPAGAFQCKNCSKEYRTEENYKLHCQSHEKCSTCDYEALPRVLKEHELIHLLPDELKFSTPDEIKKWREDRRKNYPTAANIARKAELAAEKKARGEVAQTPLHRYIDHLLGGGNNNRQFKGQRGWRGRGKNGRGRGKPYSHHQRQHTPRGSWRGSHRGGNLRGGIRNNDSIDGDSAAALVNNEPSKVTVGDLTVSSKNDSDSETAASHTESDIFSAIMADAAVIHQPNDDDDHGGSNTQEDGQENECKPEMMEKTASSNEPNPAGVSESSTDKQTAGQSRKRKQPWVSRRENKRRKMKNWSRSHSVPAKKPTLLEKLLAPEIRHEQNTILQCIHYIIEQDFLDRQAGCGSSQTAAAEAKDN